MGSRIVLSTEEYDYTYINTPQMIAFLTAVMLHYHIVFIGCSLEDELLRLRRRLSYDFAGHIPLAYALLPKNESNKRWSTWLRKLSLIECILYEIDETHSAVDSFLHEIAKYAADSGHGSLTQAELAQISIEKRLEKIGSINLDLLRFIAEQPDHAISHIDLLDLHRYGDDDVWATLRSLSPEERVYRALFLTSINLLMEERNSEGSRRYAVENAVLSQVASASESLVL